MTLSTEQTALVRKPHYVRIQGLYALAESLWLGFFAVFLSEGLGCTPLQIGLIFAWGFIAQVMLAIPTGVLADTYGPRPVIRWGFLLLFAYALGFLALFVAHLTLSLSSWFVVSVCLVAETVGALAVSLHSGAIETWASEPIRKVVNEGSAHEESPIASWYASLEISAKRMKLWAVLVGGTFSFISMSIASMWHPDFIAQAKASPMLGLPWLLSLLIYVALLVSAGRLMIGSSEPAKGGATTFRALIQAFQLSFDRIVEISVDFFTEDEQGRRLLRYMLLNALFYFGVVTVSAFWSITLFRNILEEIPEAPEWLVFLALGLAWGAMSSTALLASRLVNRLVPTMLNPDVIYATLFALLGVILCAMYAVHSFTGQSFLFLLLLVLAKFVEGVGQPYLATLLQISLPDNRTRATLVSLQVWVQSILAGLLFVGLGVVANKGFELVWLFAGVFLLVSPIIVWVLYHPRFRTVTALLLFAMAGTTFVWMSLDLLRSPVSFDAIALEQNRASNQQLADEEGGLFFLAFGRTNSEVGSNVADRRGVPVTIEVPLHSPANGIYWHRPYGDDPSDSVTKYIWLPGIDSANQDANGTYHFETPLPAAIEFNVSYGVEVPPWVKVSSSGLIDANLPERWLELPEDAIMVSLLLGVAFVMLSIMVRAIIRAETRNLYTAEKITQLASFVDRLKLGAATVGPGDTLEQLRLFQYDRDAGLFKLLNELGIEGYVIAARRTGSRLGAHEWPIVDSWFNGSDDGSVQGVLEMSELGVPGPVGKSVVSKLPTANARRIVDLWGSPATGVIGDVLVRFFGEDSIPFSGRPSVDAEGVVIFFRGVVYGQTVRESRYLEEVAWMLEAVTLASGRVK